MRHIEAEGIAELLIDSPELLTTDEVAALLRIDAATVIRWATEQRIVSINVGPKLHRFPKASLEKYLRDVTFTIPKN